MGARSDHSLRVAFLTGSLARSGAEKQLVYMIQALHEIGIEVQVYSLTRGEYYETVLTKLGLTPIWVGQSSNRFIRLYTIYRSLRRFSPHIIQTGQLFTAFYAGILGRLLGCISLGNMRSSPGATIEELGKTTFRMLLNLPTGVVVNSQKALDEIADSNWVDSQKLYLLNNVIDLEAFDVLQNSDTTPIFDNPNQRVVYIGRLIPVKRVDRYLHSLAICRQKLPNIVGLIIGSGSEEQRLRTIAEELGLLPEHIEFMGCNLIFHRFLPKWICWYYVQTLRVSRMS